MTSLSRARVWTQLINTNRHQRRLRSAAVSWSPDSDAFVSLCFCLMLSDSMMEDHQWCSDTSTSTHSVSQSVCPPPPRLRFEAHVRLLGDEFNAAQVCPCWEETQLIQSKLSWIAEICRTNTQSEIFTFLLLFLSFSPSFRCEFCITVLLQNQALHLV